MGDCLPTIDIGRKVWGLLPPFPSVGSWVHILGLTECRLGRGLPPYQVLSIQPFGHNTHGPKSGGCYAPFRGGAGSPSNTMSPSPTSVPSNILIHPTVWPQCTNIYYRQTEQTGWSRSIGRTVILVMVAQERLHESMLSR